MSEKAKIEISDSAAKRIYEIMQTEEQDAKLRLIMEGGGCSGFQVRFDIDSSVNDDDFVFEKDNAKLVIDEASLMLINGATVEYSSNLMGSWFHLTVPSADAQCSCGSSFSFSM